MKIVMTIAGSDSGGGAGVQADLKTFEAYGVFGTTAITSVTIQNTVSVRGAHDIPPEVVAGQIEALFDDFQIAAVKIGMLSNVGIVRAVAGVLARRAGGVPIVLDPVMVATSGDRLLRQDAVDAIVGELFPLSTLVTPNALEAAVLAGIDSISGAALEGVAEVIRGRGAAAVLVKGGDLAPSGSDRETEAIIVDLLSSGTGVHRFSHPRIETTRTHGTGCTLSSAIAANLALGRNLVESVGESIDYVQGALRNAPSIGHGNGPLLHSWRIGTPPPIR